MNKFRLVSFLVILAMLFSFANVSPVAAAGPIIQFDANALALQNGDTVTAWGGQSAAGTPTFLTNQTPNGMPAVQFNGGGDRMGDNVSVPASAAADWILVAVIKPQNIGAYHNLADDDPAGRPMLWIDPNFNYEMNYGGGAGAKGAGTGTDGWDIVIADSRLNQLYVNSPIPNATGRSSISYSATKLYDFFHRDGLQTFQGLVAEMRIYTDRAEFGGDFAALHSEMVAKYFSAMSQTLVFSTDFNSGVPSEFSGITTNEGVQGYAGLGTGSNVFGGNFLRNSNVPDGKTTLSLTGLPPHDSISLGYLLAIIDSWDGVNCGGDTFNVTVDGVSIFSEVFENSTCGYQTYNPPVGVELARRVQLGFTPGAPYFGDSAYNMGLDPTFQNIPHTSSTLTVEWFPGGAWQGGTDESWDLDNVQIFVHVINCAPAANAGGTYSGNESSSIAMSGATASDPDLDTLAYAWTVDSASCSFDDASALNPNLTCSDNGSYTATLSVEDGVNPAVTSDASVSVDNVAPTLGAISVDQVLVPVNTAINASADFTDPGTLDTHSAVWDWGDDASAGTVTQDAGSGSVNDSHSYSTPGVYTVKLTVTDNDGDVSNESVYQYVVVYDPNGGFVTGGGWIDSPAGAYTADPSLTGKANFGFVAKYKKGANVPDGNTQFQFKAGDLNFHSSSYEWLVVAGNKAQFKGEGTINGQGSYKFMITADDDNPDTFRIHIWDDNGTVYDNGSQQSLGGGSIVIHK